jgi:hypothetical protein
LATRASRTTGFSRSVARAIVGNDNCCRQDCFRGAVILAKAGRLGLKQPPGAEGGELRLLIRWLRRFAVLGLGIVGVWFIVFVLRITDRRLPTILALSLTCAIAAYVILPRVVRMGLKILQRKSVPSFTLTGDGLPGDPVNLALIGEFERLRADLEGQFRQRDPCVPRAGADPQDRRVEWRAIDVEPEFGFVERVFRALHAQRPEADVVALARAHVDRFLEADILLAAA